jgi:hypothetical protein
LRVILAPPGPIWDPKRIPYWVQKCFRSSLKINQKGSTKGHPKKLDFWINFGFQNYIIYFE